MLGNVLLLCFFVFFIFVRLQSAANLHIDHERILFLGYSRRTTLGWSFAQSLRHQLAKNKFYARPNRDCF